MEKLRQNCVSISGSFRKVALLWNLEFGIEWVRGRTSSLALSGPGPALGRSCLVAHRPGQWVLRTGSGRECLPSLLGPPLGLDDLMSGEGMMGTSGLLP